MLRLKDGIVELYRKVATSIPPDVEGAISEAVQGEQSDSRARETLDIIVKNIKTARSTKRPVCQDTGVPVFWVKIPQGVSQREILPIIIDATKDATNKVPLRPNAIDTLTEINSANNTGEGFPLVFFEEHNGNSLIIELMLKGGGCENVGQTYKLPNEGLDAHRDFEGVRKCVIDTIIKAQGQACPPYTLGVAIGATKDQTALLSKRMLLRKLNDKNPNQSLQTLEERLLKDLNSLNIGPIGLGGNTTALGVKIGANHRHPATYFVEVNVSCWANRRGKLIWS